METATQHSLQPRYMLAFRAFVALKTFEFFRFETAAPRNSRTSSFERRSLPGERVHSTADCAFGMFRIFFMQTRKVLALLKRPFGRNSILSISGQLRMPVSAAGLQAAFAHCTVIRASVMIVGRSGTAFRGSLAFSVPENDWPAQSVACRCFDVLGRGLASPIVVSFAADGRFSAFGASQLSGCESQTKAQQKRTPQSREGGTNQDWTLISYC